MLRRTLPTGQVLIVHGHDESGWHLELEGGAEIVGRPLNSTLADLLGFDVAHESWPSWIDAVAEDVADA